MSMYITAAGQALEANAKLFDKAVVLTHFVVGDGNIPSSITDIEKMTALRHQVDQVQINRLAVDDTNKNWLIVEGIIPPENGPYEVAEVGILAEDGTLYAVGAYPRTVKPAADSSTWGKELYIKATLATSNASLVQIKVDNTLVAATRAYVLDRLTEHEKSRNHPYATTTLPGMAELSTGTEAKARADKKTVLTPETGGLMLAEHEQAEQAHNAEQVGLKGVLSVFGDAVKTVQGVLASLGTAAKMNVAAQFEVDEGVADKVVTADKLRFGVAYRLGQNGYIALPSWLAGLIIQWGVTNVANPPAGQAVNLSVEFPNAFLIPFASYRQAIGGATIDRITASTTIGRSQIGLTGSWSTDMTFHWLAIGY